MKVMFMLFLFSLLGGCNQEKNVDDSTFVFVDADGDGVAVDEDCDDTRSNVHPPSRRIV